MVNFDFTLTLTNPCTTTTFGTMPTILDVTGLNIGGSITRTFSEVTDTSGSASFASNLCGSRTYSIFNGASAVSWATITGPVSGTYTITFEPKADNLVNTYTTFKLRAVLTSYTSITADSANFSVTVVAYQCTSSTVYTPNSSINGSQSYQIGNAALTITGPTYTTSPYVCTETMTYTLTKQDGSAAPGYASINSSTRVVSIVTTDTSLVGTVNLRIIATGS